MNQAVCSTRWLSARRGFTMVELVVVVVIMGIVSASVIPAMSNVRTMREGAARDDLVRMFEVAKGLAVASGMPHGLAIDLERSTITVVLINELGAVETEIDPLTGRARSIDLGVVYPGVELVSFRNGDGVGGTGTVWFDFEASPHMRSQAGVFEELNTLEAIVELGSGEQVAVYPYSGMVGGIE